MLTLCDTKTPGSGPFPRMRAAGRDAVRWLLEADPEALTGLP